MMKVASRFMGKDKAQFVELFVMTVVLGAALYAMELARGNRWLEWGYFLVFMICSAYFAKVLRRSKREPDRAVRTERSGEHYFRLAFYDGLTGLPNHLHLKTKLAEELEAASCSGGKLALLFLDLDGFKNINETLGHTMGDMLLAEVSNRLQSAVPKDIFVSRRGGDEFILIMKGFEHPGEPYSAAQRILGVLQKPVYVENCEIRITASIGLALYPQHGLTADNLMKYADMAMYRAKDTGRNRAVLFDESMVKRNADLESELDCA